MGAPCEVCGGTTRATDPKCKGCGAGGEGEAAATEEREDRTVAELKEELADRDLPTSGTKAELIERLEEADESPEVVDEAAVAG